MKLWLYRKDTCRHETFEFFVKIFKYFTTNIPKDELNYDKKHNPFIQMRLWVFEQVKLLLRRTTIGVLLQICFQVICSVSFEVHLNEYILSWTVKYHSTISSKHMHNPNLLFKHYYLHLNLQKHLSVVS